VEDNRRLDVVIHNAGHMVFGARAEFLRRIGVADVLAPARLT